MEGRKYSLTQRFQFRSRGNQFICYRFESGFLTPDEFHGHGNIPLRFYDSLFCSFLFSICKQHHHHHQVPDLEQTLATMPLQTSLSSDNFKKFKPLLCPPVAELQRLSRNVIRCLPLSRLPSTLPVKDKNSKPLRLHNIAP